MQVNSININLQFSPPQKKIVQRPLISLKNSIEALFKTNFLPKTKIKMHSHKSCEHATCVLTALTIHECTMRKNGPRTWVATNCFDNKRGERGGEPSELRLINYIDSQHPQACGVRTTPNHTAKFKPIFCNFRNSKKYTSDISLAIGVLELNNRKRLQVAVGT